MAAASREQKGEACSREQKGESKGDVPPRMKYLHIGSAWHPETICTHSKELLDKEGQPSFFYEY